MTCELLNIPRYYSGGDLREAMAAQVRRSRSLTTSDTIALLYAIQRSGRSLSAPICLGRRYCPNCRSVGELDEAAPRSPAAHSACVPAKRRLVPRLARQQHGADRAGEVARRRTTPRGDAIERRSIRAGERRFADRVVMQFDTTNDDSMAPSDPSPRAAISPSTARPWIDRNRA